ncbi:family 20 glycosylhydrolase [Temperatibacter marinus]|uniref:beta-N-acetylhexosaminidase n=1 Tax=Temperatibacter marinus TaxID=1456591 RepID=A0AA52EI56_9PROT|nr:family 20 glycosylhydrolase [Temperatibacter marinus]WND04078.1 family 20 glycosylhydrolase [Temperatibacter marinus]
MKLKAILVITALLLGGFYYVSQGEPQELFLPIIPKPQSIEHTAHKTVPINFDFELSGHDKTIELLNSLMTKTYGHSFKSTSAGAKLSFDLVDSLTGPEGYSLDVSENGIEIKAEDEAGLYYGMATFWQLFTHHFDSGKPLPFVKIEDKPRFKWRGLMLDEGRHFQGAAFVKDMIDWMSLHKFNILQWHLVDDQGWRIEIKKYPELTNVGAYRVPAGEGARAILDPATGEPKKIGGFYTQEQVKEIVAYAAAKHITIVPEIGLPGHAQSALAAYPEHGVNLSGKMDVSADWGIFEYTYNLEEKTFDYLEDILLEVMDLFPSEYIHLGGDEVQKNQWKEDPRTAQRMAELGIETVEGIQPYFTRHFDQFLSKYGRKMIGWDEILEGGDIHKTATVMSWRGEKGGIEAAHKGHTVIMSPWPTLYLDMHQSTSEREPTGRPALASLTPLENVYMYEPIPKELQGTEGAHFVLGAQGNIWTEHMRTNNQVMHMTFPRAAAISEAAWSSKERDFNNFMQRLPALFNWYNKLNIAYADVAFEVRPNITAPDDEQRIVSLSSQLDVGAIHYAINKESVSASDPIYTDPLTLNKNDTLITSRFKGDQILSAPTSLKLDKVSLSMRTDDTLEVCDAGYHLKLDDDYPESKDRASFNMNILHPCWIYKGADLKDVKTLELVVGQIPFNFQIGADWKHVKFDTPTSKDGELNIYEGVCEGKPLLSLSLTPALGNHGLTNFSADLPKTFDGATDLCFKFARPAITNFGIGHNLWGLDKVTLR